MANKKEPPFFNEANMGLFYYKCPSDETMELFIERLTGTRFELHVLPFEKVISVKAEIQLLEGIPVSQQHLIWSNVELKDDYCLNDYNISGGCTLKLVLAMRSGPIKTRRVPVKDPIRETAEYMDPSRDEIREKGPFNKQATFLVYRDQNFFGAVEQVDTSNPLPESFSVGSVDNLNAADEDETQATPCGQQIFENAVTMNKMKLLKAKMKNMNLSKKTKKTVKVKPHPPTAPRPSSGSAAAARQRFLRVLPHIGQSCLPPSGNSCPFQNSLTAFPSLATAGRTMPSTANDFLKEGDTWESNFWSQSVSRIRLPPKIPQVELKHAKIRTNSILTPVSSLLANLEQVSENVTSTTKEDSGLYPNLTNVELYGAEEKLLSETDTFALFTEANSPEQCSEIYDTGKVNPELELSDGDEESEVIEQHKKPIGKVLNTAATGTGLLSTRLSPQKSMLLLPLWYSSQVAHHSSLKRQTQSKCFESSNSRVGEATHLPPLNGSIQAKRKIAKHCFLCGKKTGLATSYKCRCGNNFCATHRDAETHSCTYN